MKSKTWPHVQKFAKRMEKKLAMNRHKGDREGWINDSFMALLNRLDDEVTELRECVEDRADANEIADEAADVANFAMMIADWHLTHRKKKGMA